MKKRRKPKKDRKTSDVKGILHFRRSGAATLVVGSGEKAQNYRVHARDTGTALHLDEVQARIVIRQSPNQRKFGRRGGDRPEARVKVRVEEVLKRAREIIVGTLFWDGSSYFVMPDEPRITQNISITKGDIHSMKPRPKMKDKVVVRLHEWKDPKRPPRGFITEVLGKSHTPGAEYLGILREYQLDPEFPLLVEKETREISKTVEKSEIRRRFDARDLFTITIDPDDAKDFDDALSLEHLDEQKVRIGVHIADVSHYVKPKSQLDKEAKTRGNSTYLVGTVIPMLPHTLSSGICSLVEGEDRLVKSVFLTFSKDKLIKTEFENSVIHSQKRLTYRQAYALLQQINLEEIRRIPAPPSHQTGHPGKDFSKLPDLELLQLQKAVHQLWSIASVLRKKRIKNGSLDLDMPETKIFVDKEGWADRIEKIDNDESHQLVEEFMLLANEEVAKLLRIKNIPCVHRVHDNPEEEKLNELRKILDQFGIVVGDLTKREEVTKALSEIKSHPQSHMLNIEFLRSLPKAVYRATPDGHYGLNKQDYTHFTSPIRRYSDLVVHRILEGHIAYDRDNQKQPQNKTLRKGRLEEISQHISLTERNSIDAERESVKIKLMEFFERELKKKPKSNFRAVVMDIARSGVFVELKDSGAFGMLSGRNHSQKRSWNSDSPGTTVILAGQQIKVGDEVDVVVDAVDRFEKQINFSLAPVVKKKQATRERNS